MSDPVASLAAEGALAPVLVPSGQPVVLSEVLLDEAPGALWLRFRFVAPEIARIGGSSSHDQAIADMDHLCETIALPYMLDHAIRPERIVISLADRPVPFGVREPAATQFFEIYRPGGGACIWEGF